MRYKPIGIGRKQGSEPIVKIRFKIFASSYSVVAIVFRREGRSLSIFFQNAAVTITDLNGNNVITTDPGVDIIHAGTGNVEINTGQGRIKFAMMAV